jgi:hypothetical protein
MLYLHKNNSMKALFSYLISICVSIWTYASDPIASITLSNPIEENNISLFVNTNPNAEAYTELTTAGGQECLYIPAKKYAYFRADDATITENDHDLIFKITYLDEGYGSLAFQYNAIGEELSDKYRRQSFKKTGSNTWITTTISISDASFRNLQNNNSDFRINENNYIRRIEIYKGSLDPEQEEVPTTSGSDYSEFKGKAVAGYQIWFVASQTNSGWVHWSSNSRPEPGNSSFEVYPYVREYAPEALDQTGFANLGNGEPSEVFTSALVINKHFEWMKEAGIDGVAVQRFIGDAPYPITESDSTHLVKVKKAAEANKKIFYICYDMSSGKNEDAWVQSIKFDWVYNIEQNNELTSSPAYATVGNKPVVQVWGPGFTSRVGNAAGTIELIEFLKSRGCYVIGGVPTHWRNEDRDSKPNFLDAYKTYDMVSPWTPGRYKGISEVDNFKNNNLVPDMSFCDANGLDYMPVLFPGFAWSTWNNGTPNHIPREAGNFLWRQAYNIKSIGCTEMYFAMFDEYDEGTAIMKAATDWSMIPTDYYFLTLSADGTWLSSDYYLRVAGAATAMLKSPDTSSGTVSVPHSLGPVYYRNSFESRFTKWERDGVKGEGYQKLDPCFYKDAQMANSNISSPVCQIEMDKSNAKSGDFAVKISGNPTSESSAAYSYKISEVKIPVTEGLKLSFWKKTNDDLGQYVSVDLYFKSGKKLSQLPAYKDQNGVSMSPVMGRGSVGGDYEQFISEIGTGELLGDEITGIVIAYDKAAASDSYNAFIDNILLATNISSIPSGNAEKQTRSFNRILVEGQVLNFTNFNPGTHVSIFDISGRSISSFKLKTNRIDLDFPKGIYIITTKADEGVYSQKVFLQ